MTELESAELELARAQRWYDAVLDKWTSVIMDPPRFERTDKLFDGPRGRHETILNAFDAEDIADKDMDGFRRVLFAARARLKALEGGMTDMSQPVRPQL